MKKKLFKSKTQMVCYLIIFFICIGLFIYIGNIDFNKETESDASKFAALYNRVDKDNLFVFANSTDVLNIIDGRSGIILFGFPSNKWTNYTAEILNKVAKEFNIEEILYYDFLDDRTSSNGTYETIVNRLNAYVSVDDLNTKNILAPTVLIVKKGNIIGYFDDTSIIKGDMTPSEYYTDSVYAIVYEKYRNAIIKYKGE